MKVKKQMMAEKPPRKFISYNSPRPLKITVVASAAPNDVFVMKNIVD